MKNMKQTTTGKTIPKARKRAASKVNSEQSSFKLFKFDDIVLTPKQAFKLVDRVIKTLAEIGRNMTVESKLDELYAIFTAYKFNPNPKVKPEDVVRSKDCYNDVDGRSTALAYLLANIVRKCSNMPGGITPEQRARNAIDKLRVGERHNLKTNRRLAYIQRLLKSRNSGKVEIPTWVYVLVVARSLISDILGVAPKPVDLKELHFSVGATADLVRARARPDLKWSQMTWSVTQSALPLVRESLLLGDIHERYERLTSDVRHLFILWKNTIDKRTRTELPGSTIAWMKYFYARKRLNGFLHKYRIPMLYYRAQITGTKVKPIVESVLHIYSDEMIDRFASLESDRLTLARIGIPWFNLPWDKRFHLVDSNKVITVPKDSEKDRTIAAEPTANMPLQKAYGDIIRARLQNRGVILSDQKINQGLSFRYWTTIDFENASNSLSRELVRMLLPSDWFKCLDSLRSHHGYIVMDNEVIDYEMFSSMGNGFTFELESLIFWAIARAFQICSIDTKPGRRQAAKLDAHIHGDDLIVSPGTDVQELQRVFKMAGFTFNEQKTFYGSVPFRESCGKHYLFVREDKLSPDLLRIWQASLEEYSMMKYSSFQAVFNKFPLDITPFFVRELPVTVAALQQLHNQLITWFTNVFGEIPEAISAIITDLRSLLSDYKPLYGPVAYTDQWLADPSNTLIEWRFNKSLFRTEFRAYNRAQKQAGRDTVGAYIMALNGEAHTGATSTRVIEVGSSPARKCWLDPFRVDNLTSSSQSQIELQDLELLFEVWPEKSPVAQG